MFLRILLRFFFFVCLVFVCIQISMIKRELFLLANYFIFDSQDILNYA